MTDYIRQLENPTYPFQKAEAERLADSLMNETTITGGGVIRWKSNDSVPPTDCVALAAHIGLPINVPACDAARDEETSAFIAAYRAARANRTPEEIAEQRAEARAAFGPGVSVVNVFSGERYRT